MLNDMSLPISLFPNNLNDIDFFYYNACEKYVTSLPLVENFLKV
jgi:hypothetical protein